MPITYILYSEKLDRYYIGSTRESVDDRLYKHNHQHKGFTSAATDWEIVYREEFEDYTNALAREREIKKWKSCRLIEKLIKSL
jgi:putative endonuclease